ncbi:MAG: hypothetical protein ACM3ML_03010 [Micromonosporaceae bacterium]
MATVGSLSTGRAAGEPGAVVDLVLEARRLRLGVVLPVTGFCFQQEAAFFGHAEPPPSLAQLRVGDLGDQLGPAQDLTASFDRAWQISTIDPESGAILASARTHNAHGQQHRPVQARRIAGEALS